MASLSNYFNRRFLPGFIAKRYAEVMHRGKQFVESAEANESQQILQGRIGDVGNNAFGPISVREGGTVVIDQNAGTVRISASRVWAGGFLHEVPAATLTSVPMTGTVTIGVSVTETVITEQEDAALRGIVPNTKSHGEPLGARLRYDAAWAMNGDPFYPVYTLIDGALPNEVIAPSNDIAELLVERHIRETHGSHVIDGFQVSPGGYDPVTKEQILIIGAGTLRAEGRRVSRSVDQRYRRVEDPDLAQVNGETQFYPASGNVINLNNGPIDSVQTVTIIVESVRTITHQLASGADALPDTPVYKIMAVNQGGTWNPGTRTFTGGTNYAENTSWVKAGDTISWAPAGAEVAPGSTYTVVERWVKTVTPSEIRRQSLVLEQGVPNEPVIINYRWKLRRVDVLAIDLDGAVVYIEGIPSKFNPVPPTVPTPLAPLVRIDNQWGIAPNLIDVNQRKLTEAEVQTAVRALLNLADLVSLVSLEKDVQERDPASRRGSFVDSFANDLQRDLGITQNAAIVPGVLRLPITPFPRKVDIGRVPIMLPYVREAIITQPFRTASRKINEYQNFNPLPGLLALNPAVDRWNEGQQTSSSSATSSFEQVNSYRPDLLGTALYGTTSLTSSSSSSTSVSSSTTDLPFLRQIDVEFTARRMGPGEQLDRLTFDGIDVTAGVTGTKTANAQGVMTGTFKIPASVRAGTKPVVVRGKGGTNGETSFTGQGTLTVTHYHTTTHTATLAVTIDPVAQSFVLEETRQITGAKVEFTARGNAGNRVVIELRDMEGGLPGPNTLAEGVIDGNFAIGDPLIDKPSNLTEMLFTIPTTVPAKSFRWIALLTDDPNHSVAIAQLGNQNSPNGPQGFDQRKQQWVAANPALGDLADGSNGRSWRLQPDSDLTHEIMAARYTALTSTVPLGTFKLSDIEAGGISDLLVLLIIEEPSNDTRVRLRLTRASGEAIMFEPNVRLQFDAYLTETVSIDMVLTGTATLSPIVMPECQIIWGQLQGSANYVSEANEIDLSAGNVKIRTVVEVNAPGTSSVAVDVGGPGAWTTQTPSGNKALGDGWVEREHLQSGYSSGFARTQIRMTGTPKDRPSVRKLRQRATGI